MIKVVLADTSPIFLRGVRDVFAGHPEISCLTEASERDELLRSLAQCIPDVLVLDPLVEGPRDRGLVSDLTRWYPSMGILILRSVHDDAAMMQALRAGALGYLLKNAGPEELLEGVRSVADRRRFISVRQAADATGDVTASELPIREALLSTREAAVLQQLGSGISVTQIARELGLSTKTVSTYRARICRKLDVSNTAALIRYALKTGLA